MNGTSTTIPLGQPGCPQLCGQPGVVGSQKVGVAPALGLGAVATVQPLGHGDEGAELHQLQRPHFPGVLSLQPAQRRLQTLDGFPSRGQQRISSFPTPSPTQLLSPGSKHATARGASSIKSVQAPIGTTTSKFLPKFPKTSDKGIISF